MQSLSASASASPGASAATEGVTPSQDGPGDTPSSENLIEKSALLDIAFLHGIATHRPIGPHKHFNVIPILINLDRTARQMGARIRDDGNNSTLSGQEMEEGQSEDGMGGDAVRPIKREEGAEVDEVGDQSIQSNVSSSSSTIPIDSALIWHRLDQLYDVAGLEELVRLRG
jgi:hypothetical protein